MTPSPLRNNLLRAARWVARSPFLVAWVYQHMSFALPVKRIAETPTLLAFFHPAPAYPLHILLVPRRPIASLMELDPSRDAPFLVELVATLQQLVTRFGLAEGGYRLIANGGQFQDFPYLHFHLVADRSPHLQE